MRKQLLTGAAAIALMCGVSQVSAQAPGGGPSERGQSAASDKASSGMEHAKQGGMNRSEEGAEHSQKGLQQSQSRGNERFEKNAQGPQSGSKTTVGQSNSRDQLKEQDQLKQPNAQGQNQSTKMGADRMKDENRNAQRDFDRKSDKDMNRNAQNPSAQGSTRMGSDTNRAHGVTTGAAPSPTVNLTQEQRTEVREKVLAHGPRVDNVNFALNVGVAIPHTVHVVTVPETLIRIHPEWRRHRYFVVNDQIIIVDNEWRIVAVIDV